MASRATRLNPWPLAALAMTRTSILLLVACILGCSSGRAPIKITEGSASEFSKFRRVCIYGSDADANVKVEELIADELSARIPGVIIRRPCGDNEMHITIQYQSGLSGCTHCPPPYTGPRFATAFIQARNGCDIRAEAEWSWLNGGSAERLARRFAAIFAQFIDEAATVPRSGG
jgi:hypothetical protein